MHPITAEDIREFYKYNLKQKPIDFIKSLVFDKQSQYHIGWVSSEKVYLRKGKTDILVFKKIFINKEYDFSFHHPVKTIIDAGANIGLSAIFFANKFPKAKIIAIEPEATNYELMKMNIAPYPNIYPVLGGISNESGSFKIKNVQGDHWNFMLENNGSKVGDGSFYTVEEIMNKFNFETVDFIKIDIEGGETMLFESNLGWLKKIKALSIELHDFIIPRSSNTFFEAIVENQPFSFHNYGENYLIFFES